MCLVSWDPRPRTQVPSPKTQIVGPGTRQTYMLRNTLMIINFSHQRPKVYINCQGLKKRNQKVSYPSIVNRFPYSEGEILYPVFLYKYTPAKYFLFFQSNENLKSIEQQREAFLVPWMPCSIMASSIYLGTLDQAQNPAVIHSLGITHILSIGR